MQRVKKVGYCYAKVPQRKGQGARMLRQLAEAGVNLLAFSGFPAGGRKAQLDFVPEKMTELRRVARREGWKLSPTQRAFLVQGDDRVGVVGRYFDRLADAGISVTAADGVAAGGGRYGMILWVRPKDYARAAKALSAR